MYFPQLGSLGSAFMQMMLVVGLGLVLSAFVDRKNVWHRSFLFGIAFLLALRYAWWRATETLAPVGLTLDFAASSALLALELSALVGSLSAFVILSRYRDRSTEADQHAGWWVNEAPRVAILIATYNEELEVLERTIVGAKSLRYQNKEILVLDDGRRDWLQDYCAAQGVRYMRRPDHKGSKAGNINHALDRLAEDAEPPEFVAVLDADFVPHRGFVSRSLALFHDPDVGVVQTPQHFFNADPIQHNLNISRSYPDEQRFFFDYMQSSRDAWGITICCGTSSIARYDALMKIGKMPTESVTEDFLLSLKMQEKGYKTVYLNEPLTEGLAPEGLKEYVTQRARWCLGLMQIARSSVGPFAKNNLRLRDRWSVIDSVFYWLPSFVFRIAAITFPLIYWYFNIIVVDARLEDVLIYFGVFYIWVQFAMNLLAPRMVLPLLHDVSQLIAAIPISRAAIVGLLKPKGHPFSVTAKGGDRSRIVIQWRIMAPFAILLALTFIGLCLGIFFDGYAYNDAGDGKWVVLFWTVYNLVVLSITCLACVELPRRERHVADAPERAVFQSGAAAHSVWLVSLTSDTARIRGHAFAPDDRGMLRIEGVGDVESYVIAPTRDGARVQLSPTPEQREALFLRFYADGTAPGVSNVRITAILGDVARRLQFRS